MEIAVDVEAERDLVGSRLTAVCGPKAIQKRFWSSRPHAQRCSGHRLDPEPVAAGPEPCQAHLGNAGESSAAMRRFAPDFDQVAAVDRHGVGLPAPRARQVAPGQSGPILHTRKRQQPRSGAATAAAAPAHFQNDHARNDGLDERNNGAPRARQARMDLPEEGPRVDLFGRAPAGHGPIASISISARDSGSFIRSGLQETSKPAARALASPMHEHPRVARAGADGLRDLVQGIAEALQLDGTPLSDRQSVHRVSHRLFQLVAHRQVVRVVWACRSATGGVSVCLPVELDLQAQQTTIAIVLVDARVRDRLVK